MILEAVISALIGIATEGGISKAKEKVIIILKKEGFDLPPPNDFDGVYIHTLIEFSEGKPTAVVELFKHEFIRNAFRRAYEQDNTSILIAEIENLIDWHTVAESFRDLDINPRIFVEKFAAIFHSVVDRTRTPYQIREEGKLNILVDNASQMNEQLSEISALLKYAVESSTGESDVPEQIYTDRIEQARKFVKQGQSITGKEILKGLEREFDGKEVSQKLRYDLYTNIASAHLHLEEHEDACKYLESALLLNKNEPKALANASLAALIRGDNSRAIELANQSLELDGNQPNAISVLLQAAKRENIKLNDDINQKALSHPESRRILAILSYDEGDFANAEKLYRENLSVPDGDVQDTVLLAQAIITSEEKKVVEGTHFFILPEKLQDRLSEAELLLTNTRNKWEKDDNRRRFVNTLGLLVQAQSLQRKKDLVWKNCQQILVEFPNYYPALFQCGLIEISRSNYKGAIEYFENALASVDAADIEDRKVPLATAYLQEKKFNKVVSLLQGESTSQPQSMNVERLVLLAKAYIFLHDKDKLSKTVTLLESCGKENPYVLEGLAQVQIELGEFEQAYSNLEAAYKRANLAEKSYFAIMLAEFHYQRGEFEKAIPLYESSFVPAKDVPVINHYLISLLNSGDYDKANSLAKLFREEDSTNPVFAVVEARIAEYIGELEHAKGLYLLLNDIQPEIPEHLIRAALMDYRRGRSVDAFNLLKPNIHKYRNSPRELMTIAQLGASAKIDAVEILEYAYRARRLGMNDPNIHLAYVGLFFSRESSFDESLNLEKVDHDAAVFIKTDRGTTKWYTILSEEPVDKGRGEILIVDTLAQKMMGLRKGDTLQVRESFYEQLEFTVLEIQSKYVRALQETINEFSSLFPENLGLQMIKIEDGDPTKMIAMSARQNQIVQIVNDYYTRGNLTLGQFSNLIGRNQIQTWMGLIVNSGIVKASTGTPDDQEADMNNIISAKDITLELSALLTLTNNEQLYLLSKRFENIYVAQTVQDVVIEEIDSEQSLLKDHLSIEHNHDQILVREIKESQIQHNIRVLEEVKKFIQEKCKIAPVELALKLGKEKYESFVNNLSAPAIDSILIAKQTDTRLYSDDMILRGFAKIEFAVNGIWTQPILKDCMEKGLLSEDSYQEAIAKLVFSNYYFVSINAETLTFFLKRNNWNISREGARLFEVLAGPHTSIESALHIAVVLVKDVWSKSLMLHQKIDILNLLLSSLVRNRLSIPTIQLFINSVRRLFLNSFTPWYANEIIAHTDVWLQTHLSINPQNILY